MKGGRMEGEDDGGRGEREGGDSLLGARVCAMGRGWSNAKRVCFSADEEGWVKECVR